MLDEIDFSKINLTEMLKRATDLTKDIEEGNINRIFTSKSGGGMVELSMNANNEVIDLEIDESLLDDKDSLQILIISAINDIMSQMKVDRENIAKNIVNGNPIFEKE